MSARNHPTRLLIWIILPGLAGIATVRADEAHSMPPLTKLLPEQYADETSALRTAEELEKTYPVEQRPEAVKMLALILRGSQMGPQDGWFGPAQTRYTWAWLAQRLTGDPAAKAIPRDKFSGPADWWTRLDRDGDGQATPGDLDWSAQNPWVQQASIVTRLFRRMNRAGDGRLTRDDLGAFFTRVAQDKDHLTVADVRSALLQSSGGYLPGDEPSRETLVRGFFANELGSLHEGPRLGEAAPDFTLKSVDGLASIQLSKLVGDKPLVVVLGNFTCGPFRAMYPEVDSVRERYQNDANFLMVYVREAHPTDGWKMESNALANVAVTQPTNFDERTAACTQFCQRLKPTMPVAVDELNDPVGNAYSGMPARLYVIDRAGLVAFKSGRGPFGFKPSELEQALVMALLESPPHPNKP
jgi:hypothetical protein